MVVMFDLEVELLHHWMFNFITFIYMISQDTPELTRLWGWKFKAQQLSLKDFVETGLSVLLFC